MELGFILKKIISAFIEPLSIFFVLMIIALEIYSFNKKKAIRLIGFSLIYLALISHTKIANLALLPLESAYPEIKDINSSINYVVLIGGDRFNRGWEVLKIYNKNKNIKIIVSGYEGRGTIPEAFKTRDLLISAGVNKEQIITLPKPKDTIEEAKAIKKIVKNEKFYLVTSAYHMSRAMMIFEKFALNPIPAPTNYLIKDSDKWLSLPDYWGLYKFSKAYHEYLGIVWFKLKR